jgi:DNA-binding Lrp family transcriptional regulator
MYDHHVNGKSDGSDFEAEENTTSSENIFRYIIAPKFKRRSGVEKKNHVDNDNFFDELIHPDRISDLSSGKNIKQTIDGARMVYNAYEINGNGSNEEQNLIVELTIATNADFRILKEGGIGAMRRNKIHRLTNEAYEQGGILTQNDLANLMCCSPTTISKSIRQMREDGIFVPTKGQENGDRTDIITSDVTTI